VPRFEPDVEKRPREEESEPTSDKRTKLAATAVPFDSARLERLSRVIDDENTLRKSGRWNDFPQGQIMQAIFYEIRVQPDGRRERCELMAYGTEYEHWEEVPPGKPDDFLSEMSF
jgi:hypothetical protein